MIGQEWDKPLTGWRKSLDYSILRFLAALVVLSWGYIIHYAEHDELVIDYSKYLGPDWRENKLDGKRCPTIVANHMNTVLEVLSYIVKMPEMPCFTPAHFIKQFPIGDFYIRALNSFYINRDLGKDGRDLLVQ